MIRHLQDLEDLQQVMSISLTYNLRDRRFNLTIIGIEAR